jgi:hypothetical protein
VLRASKLLTSQLTSKLRWGKEVSELTSELTSQELVYLTHPYYETAVGDREPFAFITRSTILGRISPVFPLIR